MKYMLLLYSDESLFEGTTEADMQAEIGAYGAYTEAMISAGVYHSAEALQLTATATTVSVRNNETLTTHGPFAETREQLGGFFIIDCDNLDQAIEWAAKCPVSPVGRVEIRPIMEIE